MVRLRKKALLLSEHPYEHNCKKTLFTHSFSSKMTDEKLPARSSLRFSAHIGAAIGEIIEPLARLRIQVFYEFPYLYEGSMAYERTYLQRYAHTPESFILATWDGEQLVGATTATPLHTEMEEITEPLRLMPWPLDQLFYFGESMLLPAYRGQGLGHYFFDAREQHAQSLGYLGAVFCSVVRPSTHPLRPSSYRPHDVFWQKRAYAPQDCYCQLAWLDRGAEQETIKPLQFWYRNWAED